MGLSDNITDKLMNAVTGGNLKTINVSATVLAEMINEHFIMKMDMAQRQKLRTTFHSSLLVAKFIDSPDGIHVLYLSGFDSGLVHHRTVWVKDCSTEEVFQWEGFSLSDMRNAVYPYLDRALYSSSMQQPTVEPQMTAGQQMSDGSAHEASDSGKKKIFCTSCGGVNYIDDERDAGFCRMCGKRIQVSLKPQEANSPSANTQTPQTTDSLMGKSQQPQSQSAASPSAAGSMAASRPKLELAAGLEILHNPQNASMVDLAAACLCFVKDRVEIWNEVFSCVNSILVENNLDKVFADIENQQILQQVKRGYLELEDSEWEAANRCFEQALNFDAECAEAYWGQALAVYQVKTDRELADSGLATEDNKFIKRALRFGNPEQKKRFQMVLNVKESKIIYLSALIIRIFELDEECRCYFKIEQGVVSAETLMALVPEYGWNAGAWENERIAADLQYVTTVMQTELQNQNAIVDVQLTSVGDNQAAVLKEFSAIIGVDSYTAAQFLQKMPVVLKRDIQRGQAREIKKKLEAFGATVQLIQKES